MSADAPWGEMKPEGLAALALHALKSRIIRGPLKPPLYSYIQSSCKAHDVMFEGIKFRCHIADNGPERFVILQDKNRDWSSLHLWKEHLSPGDTFIDLGANFGLFAAYAAKLVGPTGKVIAVEPIPEMARRLRFNMSANAFDQVCVIEAAVGDRAGELDLFINAKSFACTTLHANEAANATAVKVPVRTLFDIVTDAGITEIAGMKIDIEGFEDRALMPFLDEADATLWPKRILMEMLHQDDWQRDCLTELLDLGYRQIWTTPADILFGRDA